MRFTLEIELGNDAMQSGRDVVYAVSNAFNRLPEYPLISEPLPVNLDGIIRDENGNTVGTWKVTS